MTIRNFILTGTAMISLVFSSCIKDEALNTEADIETATISKDYVKLSTRIENEYVNFYVNTKAPITALAPEFTLTEGATIEPKSGTVRDFTNPQLYTVTSQNGTYKKTYTVSVIVSEFATKYSFENTTVKSNYYYEWYEQSDENNKIYLWATANDGFNLSYLFASGKPNKDNFVTTIEPNGKEGQGVKMQTLVTGKTGASVAPIAAGNLFLGKFVTNIAKPLESPRFGISWANEPVKLTGYYKYKAGEEFKSHKGNPTELTKDTFDAYAVFFKVEDDNDFLKATHNFDFVTNPESDTRIISYARIKPQDRKETSDWTYFEIPFIKLNGRKMEANAKYKLAVVFSSSIEGDKYNGAIGSVLSIDEVEVITEKQSK